MNIFIDHFRSNEDQRIQLKQNKCSFDSCLYVYTQTQLVGWNQKTPVHYFPFFVTHELSMNKEKCQFINAYYVCIECYRTKHNTHTQKQIKTLRKKNIQNLTPNSESQEEETSTVSNNIINAPICLSFAFSSNVFVCEISFSFCCKN